MLDPASINATRPGENTLCSWGAGWRSLLLRAYREPLHVEQLRTTATADQLVVLVTNGACDIEASNGGRWSAASYRAGHLGMTAPHEEVTLRWRGTTWHETLQLHLPALTIAAVTQQPSSRGHKPRILPNKLSTHDATIEQALLTLAQASRAGAPDLYAETAAHFLAAHLLTSHSTGGWAVPRARDDAALKRVDEFMRSHLSCDLSLSDLASIAGHDRFHLLRLASRHWGETPFARLTRLRMEQARRLLVGTPLTVTAVGHACGYATPAHFATAFRGHRRIARHRRGSGSTLGTGRLRRSGQLRR